MTFRVGYLTDRETRIWGLRRNRLSQSEIGRELGISRQAIHKSYSLIDSKVEQAFVEAAETNNLEMRSINVVDGVMEAFSPAHKIQVFVTLSKVNGLKTWYLYEGNCSICTLEKSCRAMLENEAEERGVKLRALDELLPPTKLAIKLFSRYLDN